MYGLETRLYMAQSMQQQATQAPHSKLYSFSVCSAKSNTWWLVHNGRWRKWLHDQLFCPVKQVLRQRQCEKFTIMQPLVCCVKLLSAELVSAIHCPLNYTLLCLAKLNWVMRFNIYTLTANDKYKVH